MVKSGFALRLVGVLVALCCPVVSSDVEDAQFPETEMPLYEVEYELTKSLFFNYTSHAAPQKKLNQSTLVNASFTLQSVYISEKHSFVSLWMLVEIRWIDKRLSWNPLTYPVRDIQVPSSDVWMPEIMPLTGIRKDPSQGVKVSIDSNGTVDYITSWELDVPCTFDLTEFPFDSQVCGVFLGSWVHGSDKVRFSDVRSGIGAQGAEQLHYDWVTSMSSQTVDISTFFHVIELVIALTRKPSYYYRVYMAPAAIIMFSVPLIHLLPPGSHEKMTLGSVLLLSVMFMLNLVAGLFTAFSENAVPKVVMFYTADAVVLFLSMVVAAFSTAVANKGGITRPVPQLVKSYLIDKLSFLCCLGTDDTPTHLNHLAGWLAKWAVVDVATGSDTAAIIDHEVPMSTDSRGDSDQASSEAVKMLRVLVAEVQYGRYREQLRLEWLQLALIIDRSLAMVFFVIAIIITAGFAH